MQRFLPHQPVHLSYLCAALFFMLCSTVAWAQRPFITTWQTTAANEGITLRVNPNVTGYNYTVDWGDGNTSAGQTGDATHNYASAGTYTVSITDDFPALYQPGAQLLSIDQWGDIAWKSMEMAFMMARDLEIRAIDMPNLSGVTSMVAMFRSATNFSEDLSAWDVSSVENMEEMFAGATSFNGDLSGWSTSGVTNMAKMFNSASAFNRDLSSWDVSAVENMEEMFMMATSFNVDLSGWNTSGVTNMARMFRSAPSFNQNLSSWDFSAVESMEEMFLLATSFNGDLSGWNTSGVTNMTRMLNNSGLSTANYDATLIGWAAQGGLQHGLSLGASGITYCAGAEARQQLIDDFGWTITDGGEAAGCGGIGPADPNHFVTVWKSDIVGGTGSLEISIPATGEFTYTWVDINNPTVTGSGNGSDATLITFPQPGTYEVRIAPAGSDPFHAIELHYLLAGNDAAKLLEVKNWGSVHWSGFQFYGCENLKVTATDIPDLSGVTSLNAAFSRSGIDEIPNINDWDVSTVTDLSSLFQHVVGFNQSLSNWDVSNVTNMSFMFDGATSFNQLLDGWDVRKLEGIDYMFRDASSFNQSLAAWQLESFVGAVGAFFRSGMSCESFSYTLYGWATNPNTNDGVFFGADGVTYSPDVVPYVDRLRNERNWTFQSLQQGTCDIILPSTPVTPDDNNILYVDINANTTAAGYTGSGDSWENAIPELADALKWAREQHDGGNPGWTEADPLRIFVAKGVYKPLYHAADGAYANDGGRDNSFVLVPNVQLYGGFDPSAGIESLEDARILPDMSNLEQGSILSGDFNGNDHTEHYDNHTENAHHVTIASGNLGSALIDGFMVTGGYAYGNTSGSTVMGQTVYRFFGGGTYVISSSPKFTHMAWFNNIGDWGGGLYNTVSRLTETSSPKLSNVTFYRNMAPGGGGGMRNFGGAVDITQAIFAHNGAGLVEDGTASGPGGGIYSSGNGTSLSVTNATFYRNWIVGVFSDNLDGGAIYLEQASALLNNVVIWENEVEGDPADPSASISVSTFGGDVTIANSLVAHSGGSASWNHAAGILDGGNNIDADPVFVSTTPGEAGYLQLSVCSPAIGAGSNQLYTAAGGNLADDLDLAGNPRVYDLGGAGVIDIGAYEYQGERLFVQSLAKPDAVAVAYGAILEELTGLPTSVTATLSDNTDVSVPLDGNLTNWTLANPAGGAFDGDVAGTYVFTVPLLIPETECYLNTQSLQGEVTIVVTKGTPVLTASWNGISIDVNEGLSLTYGDIGELLVGTTDTEGEMILAFGDEDAPVLDLGDLSAVAAQQAGTAILTVSQGETDNFEAASVEIAVNVAQKPIVVVPTANQGKVYGADEPASYAYELGEGDALAFDDALTDIVSASFREAGEGAGVYDIKLVFEGDESDNYDITFEADNNAFVITPLAITVTAEDKLKTFGEVDPALTYTFTPELIDDDAFTGELEREEGDDVGVYAITQGNLSLSNNYEITFEGGVLTITQAGYDGIGFNDNSFIYNGTLHMLELTGELPEGVTVRYEIDGDPGNGATDAGTYAIKAIIDGGLNYEDLELTATLTITPLAIMVTAEDKTKVFGAADPALTYTYVPALVGEDAFSGSLSRVPGTDVGDYAITSGDLTAGDNYAITFVAGRLTITPSGYEGIELKNTSFTYDGTPRTLGLTGDLPEGTSVTYTIDDEPGNSATDAGRYMVIANINGGSNYEDLELTATLTITPLAVTVTAEDKTKVFGSADPALTYTHVPALVGEDVFTGSLSRAPGVDVGNYTITQGNLTVGDNYAITFVAGRLTITPSGYEGIELKNTSFTYDGTPRTLGLTGDLPEGTSVTYAIDGEPGNSATDAGTYAVIANINGGSNYEDLELTATLTITPLAITVTADDQTKVFGAADPALTYTHIPELIGDDAFTGSLSRAPGTDIGDYAITSGDLTAGDNYVITFVAGRLTIAPSGYDGIALHNASFTYDGTPRTLGLTGDLPEGTSVTYEIDGEPGNSAMDAGRYIVIANINGGSNYEDLELTATLTISPLAITVTADDQTKVFGSADPALTYTHIPELIGDDAFSGSLSRAPGADVGYYAITPGDLTAGDNYTITFVAGTLTITPSGYEGIKLKNTSFTYDGTPRTLGLTGDLPEGTSVTYTIDDEPGSSATDAGRYMVIANIDGGSNYEDLELTATLTISPLAITVTAEDKTKVFGSADPALTYTHVPALVGEDVFTGSLSRAPGADVGYYAITPGDLTAGDNYAITFVAGTLTITSSGYDDIALHNASFMYGGTPRILGLTGDLPEGTSVTYTIDGEPGNSATDAGTYEVKAIIDGGNNHKDLELTATLTISPLTITVTAEDKTKVFGSADPALTYTHAPALIGEDMFTGSLSRAAGNDVGDYGITQGDLSLSDNYTIMFVAGTLTITPSGYEGIALHNASFTYDGTRRILGLTGDLPEGTSVTYEIGGEPGNSATDAGTYVVIAYIDGGSNYEDLELTATLTISPLAITVTADDQTKAFGSADPALTYTHVPALVGEDVFTGALSRVPGADVGDYAITPGNLTAGDNYAVTFVAGRLTITPAGYDGIALHNASFTYDGTPRTLRLTGDLPEGTSVTYMIDNEPGNSATDAGTYIVIANINGGSNYEDLELTATLTITPLAVTVTAEDKTKVFGSADPALTYTHVPALVGEDAFTGSLSRAPGNDVGDYAITSGNLTAGDNYAVTFVEGTLTITPSDYGGIELKNTSFTYDGTPRTLGLTGTLPEGTSVTYTIDDEPGNSATDAGTYAVIANIDGGNNHEDLELMATLTITPLAVTVTAEDKTKVFGAADPALTYTHVPALVGEDVFTGSLSRAAGNDVGDYGITQGDLSLSDNYAVTFVEGTLTITPSGYEGIELKNTSFTYDGTLRTLGLTGTLPEGTSVTYTIDDEPGNSATDAGTYPIKAIIDGGSNYDDLELTATLTISPLAITVTAEDKTKVFGSADPALTYTHVPALVGDDAFSGALSRVPGADVGYYAITPGNLTAGDNYAVTFVAGTLTITPAGYDGIALHNASFTYDGTPRTLWLTGDLPEGTSVTYMIDGEPGNSATDAGTYPIKAIIDGGSNYEDLELTATLTIVPARRHIDFPSLPEKTYGDTDFAAGATLSVGEGLSYISDNTSVAHVDDQGRISIHGAGMAVITATAAENGNFTHTPAVSRQLVVRKSRQTITLAELGEVSRDIGSVALDVVASSGLPITLSVDDPEIATLEGDNLQVHRLGTVRITATQAGDGNHEAAQAVTIIVHVVDPNAELPVRVHKVVSPNGDGINEYLLIEGIKDYPDNKVTVFNRNGTILYDVKGYDNGNVAFRGISTGQLRLPAGTYFYIAEIKVNGTWKYEKGWFVLRY